MDISKVINIKTVENYFVLCWNVLQFIFKSSSKMWKLTPTENKLLQPSVWQISVFKNPFAYASLIDTVAGPRNSIFHEWSLLQTANCSPIWLFNWEVRPLDDVPASLVPFGSEPQVWAALSPKITGTISELLRFRLSLQFRYLSRIQALCMQDGIRFSIIFSVNEVYQQMWASLFQTQWFTAWTAS